MAFGFFLAHEDHNLEVVNQEKFGAVWEYDWNPRTDVLSFDWDPDDEEIEILIPRGTTIRKDKHGNIIWKGEHAPTVLLP